MTCILILNEIYFNSWIMPYSFASNLIFVINIYAINEDVKPVKTAIHISINVPIIEIFWEEVILTQDKISSHSLKRNGGVFNFIYCRIFFC